MLFPYVPEHVRVFPGEGSIVPAKGHRVYYEVNMVFEPVRFYSGVSRIFDLINSFLPLKISLVSVGKSFISAFATGGLAINIFNFGLFQQAGRIILTGFRS